MKRRNLRPGVVTLMGATASGKTDLALEIAARMPTDIISVDSAMVYRGMDIGTAKPSKKVLQNNPHALVDVRDPPEAYSAQDFIEDADRAIHIAWERGRVPLLVGGTMMYFNVFKEGLAKLPSADPSIRENIEQRGQQEGWSELHRELVQVDPVAGAAIEPGNRQRIQRALEVYQTTGIPISELWRNSNAESASERLNCNLVEFAVTVSREELHPRIESRLDDMLKAGFVEEVEALRERWGIDINAPSMRAVGYRQIGQFLNASETSGDPDDLRHSILVASRRLAKKQSTWLRGWRCLDGRAPLSADLESMLQKLTSLP